MDVYVEWLLQEGDAESSLETVLQNILDEPIAAKTKRRLFRPLFPMALWPRRPMGTKKKFEIPTPQSGWKDLIPFIRCIMKKTNGGWVKRCRRRMK